MAPSQGSATNSVLMVRSAAKLRVSSASALNALRRDEDHAVARAASEGGNHGRMRFCALATLALVAAIVASPVAHAQAWRHAIEPRSDAGFQIMAVRGAFSYKQGVDINLPTMPGDAAMLRALLAGELESYEGGPAAAIVAGSKGADLKILGCHWQSLAHGVFGRTELKAVPDIKGATMATSAADAAPDMIGKAWLALNDIAVSDVKFAGLGNDPERLKALRSKAALAAVISIEHQPIVEKQGIKLLARGRDVLPNYLRLCTVSSGKAVQARREDAVRFLSAQMQGLKHALVEKDEVIKATRQITRAKADDPRPEFMFNEAKNPSTGVDPAMPIDMAKLNWLQEQLVKAGAIGQAYDLGRIVDDDIRKDALRRARL
jgi:NitT/TauT family transport system substrate-binding protein